jgi:putative glutamine amidotransferase
MRFYFYLEHCMTASPQSLIGITSGLTTNKSGSPVSQLGQAYTAAIEKEGGIALIIPVGIDESSLAELLPRLDGILFSGGGDIDPALFDGNPHPRVYGISAKRDALEIELIKKALSADKPLLAICRGIQVLNVAMGGTLFTHIQDQRDQSLKHDWFPDFPRDKLAHTIRLTPRSKLHQIYGTDEIRVNSLHHQGLAEIGLGLRATGFAPDDLVEGVEVEGASFAIGVQWHPECLPNDPGSQALFRAFVKACGVAHSS